ncbi:MAG TPA: hypothetical protein VM537_33590 [Anaerolineae bacterium]|nr:hypothetical protein [Anaerolineae bacterium]
MKAFCYVLVCITLCVLVGSAEAGIPINGYEVSYTAYNPIGGGDTLTLPTLTLRPFSDEGPATPGELGEVLPWLKSNLGVEVPFEGDDTTLLRPRGIGVSEAVRVGSAGGVPVRAGIAWVSGAGTCVFLRAAVLVR